MSLTQMGHKTLRQVKIQHNDIKRLALQGTFLSRPTLRQRPKHTQQGQQETEKIFPEGTSYKQEQTWTLYSPF